jgi:hypothetical protein
LLSKREWLAVFFVDEQLAILITKSVNTITGTKPLKNEDLIVDFIVLIGWLFFYLFDGVKIWVSFALFQIVFVNELLILI